MKHNKTKLAYIICTALSLFFHVYNDISLTESIKLFHLFAVLSIVTGSSLILRRGRLQKYVFILLGGVLVSCSFSYYGNSLSLGIGVAIIMLSVMGLQYVDVKRVLIVNNLLAPIVIVSLLYLNFTEPTYRFCGYYNDPNYLCTTLLVYLFLIISAFQRYDSKILKVGLAAEMLAIFVLVSFTLSRTGMLCTVIMLLTAFSSFFIKSWKEATIIGVLIGAFVMYNIPHLLNGQMDLLEERIFERGDNAENAAKYRRELSMRGVKYVIDNPQMLPFGIGLGALAHNDVLPGFNSQDKHGDHNTFTAYFSELGLFTFTFFLILVVTILKLLYKGRKMPFGYLRLITYLVFIVFSFSINQTQYLPFWWMMFFLINFGGNENTTHSLLRQVRQGNGDR